MEQKKVNDSMARLKIYAALRDDVNQGWIWLGGHDQLPNRSVVKLVNKGTSRSIYCEACLIDDNFLRIYNKNGEGRIIINEPHSALVISEWYRIKLGAGKLTEVEINVTESNCLWGKTRACLHHPQVVVRLATWLGLLGFFLGILGVLFGLVPLLRN